MDILLKIPEPCKQCACMSRYAGATGGMQDGHYCFDYAMNGRLGKPTLCLRNFTQCNGTVPRASDEKEGACPA